MNPLRAICLLAVFVAASTSCRRSGGGDDDPPPVVNPGGPEAFAAQGSTPPVVVTFNVAFAENVPQSTLEAMAAKFETANESLWNMTEGQVRIGKVRITDNAHPGSTSNQYAQLNLTAHDMVVWSSANFNGPGIAYVLVGTNYGRFGRFMGMPYNIANTTLMHELGHFLYELSWSVAPVLVDEYNVQPQDPACVMELTYTPLKYCSVLNHLDQPGTRQNPGQPHSCWTQILIDYPDFTYANLDVAPDPPPAPTVEYTDVP